MKKKLYIVYERKKPYINTKLPNFSIEEYECDGLRRRQIGVIDFNLPTRQWIKEDFFRLNTVHWIHKLESENLDRCKEYCLGTYFEYFL